MTFYHGTSDIFSMGTYILPARCTGIKREDWRKTDTDVVFMTTSYKSAYVYAKKASEKYGGSPVVYRVVPIGQYYQRNGIEWIADIAVIVAVE